MQWPVQFGRILARSSTLTTVCACVRTAVRTYQIQYQHALPGTQAHVSQTPTSCANEPTLRASAKQQRNSTIPWYLVRDRPTTSSSSIFISQQGFFRENLHWNTGTCTKGKYKCSGCKLGQLKHRRPSLPCTYVYLRDVGVHEQRCSRKKNKKCETRLFPFASDERFERLTVCRVRGIKVVLSHRGQHLVVCLHRRPRGERRRRRPTWSLSYTDKSFHKSPDGTAFLLPTVLGGRARE